MGSSQITEGAENAGVSAGETSSAVSVPPFRPHRLLRGGHVQTLASFVLPRHIHLPPAEERLVEVAAGVRVRCLCHWLAPAEHRSERLTLIVVHGLEGSDRSQYMLGIANKGLAAGMNVVLMNQRNCGGMNHGAPTLYNSSLSGDVAAVVRHLIEHDGISRFALSGFSMGGNLVLKLAGEWGQQAPAQLRAVAACCPALDLAASADALHEPANRIYETYFLWALRRRMHHKARLFPGHFDVGRMRRMRSLREFDDRITAYYCGFSGVDDYYDRASAAHVVGRIAVPALIVHAADDPFIRITPETRRKITANPNLTFRETAHGGHCAFVGARNGLDDGYWAESQIVIFLRGF